MAVFEHHVNCVKYFVLYQNIEKSVEGPHRSLQTKVSNPKESLHGRPRFSRKAIIPDGGDENVFTTLNPAVMEVDKEVLKGLEGTGTSQLLSHGKIGVVVMGEAWMKTPSMVKYLEG